jgi:hypothetical protein
MEAKARLWKNEPSVMSGYLWAPGPGSSHLGLDSTNPTALLNPQNAFIQHKISKSISQWTNEDLYRWYEEEDQKPRDWPYEWIRDRLTRRCSPDRWRDGTSNAPYAYFFKIPAVILTGC